MKLEEWGRERGLVQKTKQGEKGEKTMITSEALRGRIEDPKGPFRLGHCFSVLEPP